MLLLMFMRLYFSTVEVYNDRYILITLRPVSQITSEIAEDANFNCNNSGCQMLLLFVDSRIGGGGGGRVVTQQERDVHPMLI